MNNKLSVAPVAPVDRVLECIIFGDLSGLSRLDKSKHYIRVCRLMGLKWWTRPFAYLKLQGKETLYPTKDCTDQLRGIHSISIEIITRELIDGIYTVRARSSDPSGRKDEDEGSVPLPDNYKGEIRSNAMMKATTKAKRRVTLSHCGLGFAPDESEIESIHGAETSEGPSLEDMRLAEQDEQVNQDPEQFFGDAARSAPGAPAADAPSSPSPPAPAATISPEAEIDKLIAAILAKAKNAEERKLFTTACEAARRGHYPLVTYFNSRSAQEKTLLRRVEPELVSLYPTNEFGSNRED